MVGGADRVRRPRRAAIYVLPASWTIVREDDSPATHWLTRQSRRAFDQIGSPAVAARPRERATKAERGAGSAAAVPRSGAALDLCMAEFGNAQRLSSA